MQLSVGVLIFTAFTSLVNGAALEKRVCAGDVATLGFAAYRNTTGGAGATPVTVTTLAALTAAVAGDTAKIVFISGTITGNAVIKVGSNTSILGQPGSLLAGVGLRVLDASNVIIRNIRIQKVLADAGDAIGIQSSNRVWVDHVELSSDLDHDKDYYDGLFDVTHGSYGITLSWSILATHYKASLVGHSDSNSAEDAALEVSFGLNYWHNLNTRVPTIRFGIAHIYNNYFYANNDCINVRNTAQVLVQNNVWESCTCAVYPTSGGGAVLSNNVYGNATAPTTTGGTFISAPYNPSLIATSSVKTTVLAGAGQKLTFSC